MPQARADKEYRLPLRGFNTEASLIDFPVDEGYCVDISNMIVDFDPLRLRVRDGHDHNELTDGSDFTLTSEYNRNAFSVFLWERVGGDSDVNIICYQNGANLHFIDASSANLTDLINSSEYLLLEDVASGTSKGSATDTAIQPLSYVRVKGDLVIMSEAIDPTLIQYDGDTNSFDFFNITLKVRDIWGLESGIDVDKRPTAFGDFPASSTASTTYTQISEDHEYNLYNQGWYMQRRVTSGGTYDDPIAKFYTDLSEYPSNADIVYLGMAESSGDLVFEPDLLKDQTFGTTPAPRGHYVLDAFDMDRETRRGSPEISNVSTGGSSSSGGGDPDGYNPSDLNPTNPRLP